MAASVALRPPLRDGSSDSGGGTGGGGKAAVEEVAGFAGAIGENSRAEGEFVENVRWLGIGGFPCFATHCGWLVVFYFLSRRREKGRKLGKRNGTRDIFSRLSNIPLFN